ncbi:MAG: hypothetical protein GX628_00685 [Clostridiales bacterium]|nr:hypothetical protein [Clostridiales bacterium]
MEKHDTDGVPGATELTAFEEPVPAVDDMPAAELTIPEEPARKDGDAAGAEITPAFTGNEELLTALGEYLGRCAADRRIPNIFGFCAACRITFEAYTASEDFCPEAYDIARSVFIDAGLNQRIANPSERVRFLAEGIEEPFAPAEQAVQPGEAFPAIRGITCEHDAFADGI